MFYIKLTIVLVLVMTVVLVIKNAKDEKDRTAALAYWKNYLRQEGFTISKQMTVDGNYHSLLLDEKQKKWVVIDTEAGKPKIYRYSDLLDYEVVVDSHGVVKGSLSSALIGGVLFGQIGAIIGGAGGRGIDNVCKSLAVRILINDIQISQITIPLIRSETKVESKEYRKAVGKAEELTSALAIIGRDRKRRLDFPSLDFGHSPSVSVSEEIERLHDLMERGILTKREFEKKKTDLLS